MMQGKFLKFSLQEQPEPIWQCFMWNLKYGTEYFCVIYVETKEQLSTH